MFYDLSHYIIIGRNEIYIINNSANAKSRKTQKFPFDLGKEETHKPIYENLKTIVGSGKVGVLLSEDMVYVFASRMKVVDDYGAQVSEHNLVRQKVKTKVPDVIDNLRWDFRSQTIDNENKLFQIAVIEDLLANFINKFTSIGISIAFVEPLSYSIARQTQSIDNFHIVIFVDSLLGCVVLANQGYVYYSSSFEANGLVNLLEDLESYVRGKYSMDLSIKVRVIVSAQNAELEKCLVSLKMDRFTLEYAAIDPFHGLDNKKLHYGKDNEVLNIPVEDLEPASSSNFLKKILGRFSGDSVEDSTSSDPVVENKSGKGRLVAMISFLVVLLVAVPLAFYYRNSNDETSNTRPANLENVNVAESENPQGQDSKNEATDELVPLEDAQLDEGVTQEAIPPIDFRTLKIQVLNGSGIPGEASRASGLLTSSGFGDPETGNASRYDYVETEVKVKESVPKDAIYKISTSLSVYTVAVSSDYLSDESLYDIQIIIGSDINESAE